MATNKVIKVVLEDEEIEFLEWLAKRDRISFQREMRNMFYTELSECMVLYNDERLSEIKGE